MSALTETQSVRFGSVDALYRYPVKSMQGLSVDTVELTNDGVAHDRQWALIDAESGKLMSAKRWSKLLLGVATDDGITLPDGTYRAFGDDDLDAVLSGWLGRDVVLRHVDADVAFSYEMTFDPPNDGAELFEIPTPSGSFLDLAPLHLVSRQTLDEMTRRRADLNWDVRRFRPNLVVDAPGLEAFGEDTWCGRRLVVGSVVAEALQPTVRCAMPLRAQPGLASQPSLFSALDQEHANHLGIYLTVVSPGIITKGDQVDVTL
jgi:uncharacterized protein